MKHVALLFIAFSLVTWPVACANSPDSPEFVPAPTTTPASLPAAMEHQNEATSAQTTVNIGSTRFVTRSITMDTEAIAASDFDGDGRQDLVAAGEPELTIYRGDAAGGLTVFSRVPGGQEPNDFALADLDEDGDVDIVVANHDTDYLTILLGDGRGYFQPAPDSPLRIDVQPHPHAVRAADLNADGHVDLVVDHREAGSLLILRGLGEGRFELPGMMVDVGGDPYLGLALGDVNADGKLDLVTPNPDEVGLLFNASDEGIEFVAAPPVAVAAAFAVGLGDFNGDSRLDLIAASDEGSPLVELFYGNGRGGFEAAPGSPFRLAPGGMKIVVADFDGDDFDDAVVAIVALLHAVRRRFQFRLHCPDCGETNIVELDRETLASRTVEYIGAGTDAGGDVRLQLDLECTYRCQSCGGTFKRWFTRTH